MKSQETSDIAVRVRREGRYQSLFLHELKFITYAELRDFPPNTARAVREWIEADGWRDDTVQQLWFKP